MSGLVEPAGLQYPKRAVVEPRPLAENPTICVVKLAAARLVVPLNRGKFDSPPTIGAGKLDAYHPTVVGVGLDSLDRLGFIDDPRHGFGEVRLACAFVNATLVVATGGAPREPNRTLAPITGPEVN